MPKLQGFSWHIVSFYNTEKAIKARKENAKYRKKKKINDYGLVEKEEKKESTKYVYTKNDGLKKVIVENVIKQKRKVKYYTHKSYGMLRFSKNLGDYTYFKKKNSNTIKINKKTVAKWKRDRTLIYLETK